MLPYVPARAILTPVPTASSRLRSRGYDQARLLAKALSRLSGQPMTEYLVRQGQIHQVGASRAQRLVQLRAAFRVVRPAGLQGARIVLIDDVTTTGATLELAAAALLAAGARQVDAITFAYTPITSESDSI